MRHTGPATSLKGFFVIHSLPFQCGLTHPNSPLWCNTQENSAPLECTGRGEAQGRIGTWCEGTDGRLTPPLNDRAPLHRRALPTQWTQTFPKHSNGTSLWTLGLPVYVSGGADEGTTNSINREMSIPFPNFQFTTPPLIRPSLWPHETLGMFQEWSYHTILWLSVYGFLHQNYTFLRQKFKQLYCVLCAECPTKCLTPDTQ